MIKKTAIIGLILLLAMLILPVTAGIVWMNGNAYTDEQYAQVTAGDTVICDMNDHCSKYKDTNPAKSPEVWAGKNSCTGFYNIRSGYDRVGMRLTIANNLTPNRTQDLVIPSDGVSGTIPEMAQGTYILHLIPPDPSFGPDQYSEMECNGQGTIYMKRELIGYAATQTGPTCTDLKIKDAKYGAIVCTQVIDVPAHDEYRYWIPASGHWEGYGHGRHWHEDVPAHWSEWSNTHPSDHFQYQTRSVPATYKTVCDGTYKDVTSIIQGLVSCGHLNIVADYKNQHYNVLFGDPTPGTFKMLSVQYSVNNIDRTKTVEEDNDLIIP